MRKKSRGLGVVRHSHRDSTNVTVDLAVAEHCEAWTSFLEDHADATYCHWFEWKTVLERAYRKACFWLYAIQDGRWAGVLPLVHMKGLLAGNRLVSMPFLDQGGIVASSDAAVEALRNAAFQLLRERGAKGLDLRGGGPSEPRGPSEATSRYRFLLALGSSEELLWKSIGPKVRNQIRKSRKEGLVTSAVSHCQLGQFYEVFRRNMHDLGSPVHSRALFEEILGAFGPRARLYLTQDASGETLGGGIAFRFKDTVVVPWARALAC